jgi:hypothetical protein
VYADTRAASTTAGFEQPLPALFWNTWIERADGVKFTPSKRIVPDSAYVIQLHLAPFAYGAPDEGVVANPIGKTFSAEFAKWLDDTDKDVAQLDFLVLYDSEYFEPPDEGPQREATISLSRFRELRASIPSRPQNPFAALRSGAAPFDLAGVTFRLRTKGAFPKVARRQAAIAISIWDHDARKPLDEVAVAFCAGTASECSGATNTQYGYGGFDAVRVSADGSLVAPAAAIHLVEFGTQLYGVLRHADKPQYFTWPLDVTFKELADRLQNQLSALYGSNEAQRLASGAGLLQTIFPESAANPRATQARTEFVYFLRSRSSATDFPGDDLPAIFFRVASKSSSEPTLWPLALIAFPTSDARGERTQFLGYNFRVESPLTNQNYAVADTCVDDWVFAGPTTSGATASAREKLKQYLDVSDNFKNDTIRFGDATRVPVTDRMEDFLDYISGNAAAEAPSSDRPTMLSVLSHHDRSNVYFDTGLLKVNARNVRRNYSSPSVALLNGCETGEPGAADLIRSLNEHGIHAAIATISGVEASMAGDFLACFLQQVSESPPDGLAIGVLHTKTLRCLQTRGPYESKVLFYGLLGNSALKVCKPR